MKVVINYLPVNPWPPQMLSGQLHYSIEPFPESKIALAERLLAELRPAQHLVRFRVSPPERLLGQKSHVFIRQLPARRRSEL